MTDRAEPHAGPGALLPPTGPERRADRRRRRPARTLPAVTGATRAARRRTAHGSSVLYAVVLSPVIMLVLALAVDIGALQLDRERLRSAVDQAVLAAAGSAAHGGDTLRVDATSADRAVRRSLLDNLLPLEGSLDGTSAVALAADADVAVVTSTPAADPFDPAVTLTRPSIVARVRAPVSTGLLRLAGVPSTVTLTLTAAADLRITGIGA